MAKKSKKQKETERQEKIKLQRDRLNVIMPPIIELLSSPVGQTLLWWQISKRVKVLDTTNKIIVGKELVELLDLIPTVDLDLLDIPPAIQLGAMIQEIEDFQEIEFQKIITDMAEGLGDANIGPGAGGAGQVAGDVFGDLITRGFNEFVSWLKTDPLEELGKPEGVGN